MNILFIANPDCSMSVDRYNFIKKAFPTSNVILFDGATQIVKCNRINNKIVTSFYKIYIYVVQFLRLYLTVKKNKISHIHFHGAYYFLLNLFPIFFGGKVLVTPQGSEINEECRGYIAFFIGCLLRRADAVTVKSRFMHSLVCRHIRGESKKIHFLNWGIDEEFFANINHPEFDAVPRILSLRATGKIYNIDKIFEAVSQLKDEGYKFIFAYVEFNKEPSVELNLDICDEVYKNLDKNEVIALLSKTDYMVSIPSYDGFATSVMESLAVGVMPIISDIESYRGEFEDKNLSLKTSLAVDDVKSIIALAIHNIEDARATRACRSEFAKASYSKDSQLNNIKNIYANLDKGNLC